MIPPLVLLHLSDLHFGLHGRFAGQDMNRLSERFHQAIEDARKDLCWAEIVRLMVVTGDVAEAARRGEYKEALTRAENTCVRPASREYSSHEPTSRVSNQAMPIDWHEIPRVFIAVLGLEVCSVEGPMFPNAAWVLDNIT